MRLHHPLATVALALAALVLACTMLPGAARAADLPQPQGAVLLTVDGLPGAAAPVRFDLTMLKALPATTFKTNTIWTEGPQTFTGVPLKALLDQLGVTSGTLSAAAINDYVVQLPVSDAVNGGPIIAYERNGKPMSVRDKGPLWVVYPYDQNEAYRSEVIYSRSIWQLVRITVRP